MASDIFWDMRRLPFICELGYVAFYILHAGAGDFSRSVELLSCCGVNGSSSFLNTLALEVSSKIAAKISQ